MVSVQKLTALKQKIIEHIINVPPNKHCKGAGLEWKEF